MRASLQRLQLNYIDIVIIHKADPMCPMEGGYSDLIERGPVSLTSAESTYGTYSALDYLYDL